MEDRYYDDISIAANCKREQLMKEAEEYRLRHHITFMKIAKAEKATMLEKRHKYVIDPQTTQRPTTVR
jgi:hypothetical protein